MAGSYGGSGDDPRPLTAPAPNDADVSHDELEFDPSVEPRQAGAWLNLLRESQQAFEDWNTHCDRIDERFASLARLANMARNKEYQLFWANAEVLKPAIYATPPRPVVVPRFKDRRPVYQAASELLERCCDVSFEIGRINDVMMHARDDLALNSRGVIWCRYQSKKDDRQSYYSRFERVCYDYKDRRDFLHSISRTWEEVWWVAAASYLTRDDARRRFHQYSGDAYQQAEYRVDRDTQTLGGVDARERACFWEIWNKNERRVVWVAEGCELILDEDDPHLDLSDFFPCPKPAYGTVQRRSLVPVPDVLQYKDQLDEIDMLTGRIHALSDVIEAKGFYPSGGGELAEAINTAVGIKTPGRVLVPIKNWAAFGGSKEVIVWMPIDMIAQVVTSLVDLRKQVIEDVYQIMGLSDIMRGATDARETLGAQELKTQYGSSRIRDKQYELARLAKDLVSITADILTSTFAPDTLIEMSQTQLPTQQMQQDKITQIAQQVAQQQQAMQMVQNLPQMQQVQQQNPDGVAQAQQVGQKAVQDGQDAIEQLKTQPTVEQVLDFLQDCRARAFTLDIETDSTIVVDENAEKERTTEFVQMLGVLLPQLAQMTASAPQTAPFCGEVLKFAVKPYRAGRSLDGAVDELVETTKQMADQPRPDDPTIAQNKTALQIEQMKQQRQAQQDQATNQLKAQELQMKDQHERMKIQSNEQLKMLELNARGTAEQAKARQSNLQSMAEGQAHQADMLGKFAQARAKETEALMKQRELAARTQAHQAAAMRPPAPPARPF
jgi:hypothetical protein